MIPSVPVSEGIEIRHGCQFISSLVRALAKLPEGLGRVLPCGLGSHMSRLRHLGWNQAVRGFRGILKVQLWSFLMAFCSSDTALRFLPCGFTLGLYPGLVMGVVKSSLLLLVISWMKVVTRVKGSGFPRKTRPGASSHGNLFPRPGVG